jgi:hypothetical protein
MPPASLAVLVWPLKNIYFYPKFSLIQLEYSLGYVPPHGGVLITQAQNILRALK